jgi:hypothetical protein
LPSCPLLIFCYCLLYLCYFLLLLLLLLLLCDYIYSLFVTLRCYQTCRLLIWLLLLF